MRRGPPRRFVRALRTLRQRRGILARILARQAGQGGRARTSERRPRGPPVMTSPNLSDRRDVALNDLKQHPRTQVLIVGGGVNGAAVFRDLALQCVDCILVDNGDWCRGTSAAPSRLIHGGLIYLLT